MRRRWKYLLAVLLLAAGLLAGCTGRSGRPPQDVKGTEVQGAGAQSAGASSAVGQGAGAPGAEVQGTDTQDSATQGTDAQDPATQNPATQGTDTQNSGAQSTEEQGTEASLSEDGVYTSKEEVAAYIALYGHLPDNFITKKEAKALGWVSSKGNLGEVAPGKSIGGDYFGNFEGHLPEKEGRDYHECDVDSDGGFRGAKRIVYSNDGLVYYTEDHYETFELLYGEE